MDEPVKYIDFPVDPEDRDSQTTESHPVLWDSTNKKALIGPRYAYHDQLNHFASKAGYQTGLYDVHGRISPSNYLHPDNNYEYEHYDPMTSPDEVYQTLKPFVNQRFPHYNFDLSKPMQVGEKLSPEESKNVDWNFESKVRVVPHPIEPQYPESVIEQHGAESKPVWWFPNKGLAVIGKPGTAHYDIEPKNSEGAVTGRTYGDTLEFFDTPDQHIQNNHQDLLEGFAPHGVKNIVNGQWHTGDQPSEDSWNFSSIKTADNKPQIVSVPEDQLIVGDHPENEEGAKWMHSRRPFVYDRGSNTVLVGPRGTFHSQISDDPWYSAYGAILHGNWKEDSDNLSPDISEIQNHDGVPPEVMDHLNDHFGVTPKRDPSQDNWNFSSVKRSALINDWNDEDWEEPSLPGSYDLNDVKPWSKGNPGKGYVTPEGGIHTWATDQEFGSPHHQEVAQNNGNKMEYGFTIDPRGYVNPDIWSTPEQNAFLKENLPKHKLLLGNGRPIGEDEWHFGRTANDLGYPTITEVQPHELKPRDLGEGTSHPFMKTRRPVLYSPYTNEVRIGPNGAYHSEIQDPTNDWGTGALLQSGWNEDGGQWDYEHNPESPYTDVLNLQGIPDHIIDHLKDRYVTAPSEDVNQNRDDWNFSSMNKASSLHKTADKLNDFLMNPQSRPDLQTPEAQNFLGTLQNNYHNPQTDPMTPWLTREWKKNRLTYAPNGNLQYQVPGEPEQTTLTPARLNSWADWYGSNHPTRQGMDLMQQKLPDVHDKVAQYQNDLASQANAANIVPPSGVVHHTLPNNWTIQQLYSPQALTEEGDRMGHCVGGYCDQVRNGDTKVYSLRDDKNIPHVTMEVKPNNTVYDPNTNKYIPNPNAGDQGPHSGEIEQIQGQGNTIPKPEYQAMIKHWMNTIPPEQRPRWKDNAPPVNDMDDIYGEAHGGYGGGIHPHGDYGVQGGETEYNWPSIIGSYDPRYHDDEDQVAEAIANHHKSNGSNPSEARDIDTALQEEHGYNRDAHEDEFDDLYDNGEYGSFVDDIDPEDYQDKDGHQDHEAMDDVFDQHREDAKYHHDHNGITEYSEKADKLDRIRQLLRQRYKLDPYSDIRQASDWNL